MNYDPIDEKILRDLYINQRLTMKQISEVLGVAVGKVFKYMKKYNIESRKYTEEWRRRISESNKGRSSPLKGTHLSEEAKKKMSDFHKGRYVHPSEFGGHSKKRNDGYIYVYCPEHPKSSKDGYRMEHILIMEKHIGRYLKDDEVVHHKNHIRDDNRVENLQVMTFKEHAALHMRERWQKKKGEMAYQ